MNILESADQYFKTIIPIIIFTTGLIGNPIVFYILTRPNFIKEPTFRYFLITEVVDSIGMFGILFVSLLSWTSTTGTALFCKITQYCMYVLYSFYPCISSLISFDRLIHIKFTNELEFRKKFKYQALAVISIFIFTLLTNVPFFIYIEHVNKTNQTYTKNCYIVNHQIGYNLYLVNIIFLHGFPFMMNLLCVFFTLRHMIITKNRILPNQAVYDNYNREIQIIKSVLAMDIWYVVCYVPLYFLYFFEHRNAIVGVTYGYWTLLSNFIAILTRIQTGCNIFVFIGCSKQFREKLLSIRVSCYKKETSVEQLEMRERI